MKDIRVLRNHLFEALNRLADATGDELETEINKSASIVQVADALIRTAQAENQFVSITKGVGSGFIPLFSTDSIEPPAKSKGKLGFFDVDKEKNWMMNDGKVLQKYDQKPEASVARDGESSNEDD
jgi:hypothetical protein